MEKCFALDFDGNCTALKNKKCENCQFYRTDLLRYKIEMDIDRYSPEGKKNDYSILL